MYAMELMRMSDLEELLEEYERLVMYKVMYKEFASRVELIRNELLRRMK